MPKFTLSPRWAAAAPRLTVRLLIGLTGCLLWLAAQPRPAWAQDPTPPPHGSANCLMCHADPTFTGNLDNGESVPLYVEPGGYYRSVHAAAGLECAACHSQQKNYPHAQSQITCEECHGQLGGDQQTIYKPLVVHLNYPDARALTLTANEACRPCHQEKYAESADSAHARVLAGGNRQAPVCVDCHGSHAISQPDEPRAKISQTCAQCHAAVYSTYRTSVHGAAVENESNPDVPTCVDCHGVHHVSGPRDPDFHNASINICGKCHGDQSLMAKYGLSTSVFETYLDDFHGRTVNFFRRANANMPSNKATCFDCHGIHNIRRTDDPLSSVYPANLQRTCQQCHTDASVTFPQAWLSHYEPTWAKTPTLFGVNLAYQILIPSLLAGFLAYIGLDARRRFASHSKTRHAASPAQPEEESLNDDEA